MSKYPIARCPHCEQPLPESAKALIAARVPGPITPGRNAAASHNAFATDILAAEDCVDPNAAPVARTAREGGAL